MVLTNAQIVLGSSTGVYCPGSVINGSLIFTLDRPKQVKAIRLKILGIAKTHWSESSSDGEDSSYSGKEEYFSNSFSFSENRELPAGNHEYPFSTILPVELPDSFDSDHGKIQYSVKATLDCSWWSQKRIEKVFSIINQVDLNHIRSLKGPVKLEFEKFLCRCWCTSGPLTLVVKLPFTGFVAGQRVPLTLEIDNASSVRVENVAVNFMKFLEWKSNTRRKKQAKVKIVKFPLDAVYVAPNGSKSLIQQLTIPSVPACKIDQCSIIKCYYYIEVTAQVSGCHTNLTGKIPIIVGTVPIYLDQPSLGYFPSAPIPGYHNPPQSIALIQHVQPPIGLKNDGFRY